MELAKDVRSLERVPLAVKPIYPSHEDGDVAKAAEERQEQAKTEKNLAEYTWYLFIATAALAFVALIQAGMFYWQLRLMREGLDDTARATKAATRASHAAVAIELPVIRPSPPSSVTSVEHLPVPGTPYGGGIFNGNPLPPAFVINQIELSNGGRSHALLTEILLGWSVAGQLAQEPAYPTVIPCMATDILKADGIGNRDVELGIELTDGQIQRLTDGSASFWFFGCVKYLDFLDEPHEVRFCWKWGREVEGGIFYFFSPPGLPASYIRRI